MEKFKVRKALWALEKAYKKIDSRLEKVRNDFSCTVGCAGCCNSLVEATIPEALYTMSEFPVENYIPINKVAVRQTEALSDLAITCSNDPQRLAWKWHQLQIPCLFLYENKCAVYKWRPSKCRTHFVFNDALQCSQKNGIISKWNSSEYDSIAKKASDDIARTVLGVPSEGLFLPIAVQIAIQGLMFDEAGLKAALSLNPEQR